MEDMRLMETDEMNLQYMDCPMMNCPIFQWGMYKCPILHMMAMNNATNYRDVMLNEKVHPWDLSTDWCMKEWYAEDE